jgi:uncharacterized membrane protein
LSKPPHKLRNSVVQKPAAPAAEHKVTVEQRHIKTHSGPIPDPATLAEYDALLPGAAERILRMAERQQASRLDNEQRQLEADIRHRDEVLAAQKAATQGSLVSDYIGQGLGFFLAAACLAIAAYAGLVQGNGWVAAVFVSLPAVGIIRAVRGMMDKEPRVKK